MKKVAIVTLTHVDNYGNRLQNYALQEILKQFGCEVETIYNDVHRFRHKVKLFLIDIKYSIVGKDDCKFLRKRKFDEFNTKYIKWSKYTAKKYVIDSQIENAYDYFITGSDQVWNPFFSFFGFYFLDFVCNKEKKIAYGASFGVNKLPPEQINQYSKWLRLFKAISVREKDAIHLTKSLGYQNPVCVLDPTMLLTKEEWSRVAKKPDWADENKFVLVYFLGSISTDAQSRIDFLKNKYKVIYLENEDTPTEYIKSPKAFATDPLEFLWLIQNCETFITDSFHGCVFSILFDKEFYVFDRKHQIENNDMNSRLINLLSTFNMTERYNIQNGMQRYLPADTEYIDKILRYERKKSIDFLKKALED